MGIVLFALYVILETALAVLSCTKFREKLERAKNKTILRSAEIALLAVFIILPAGQKWRFTFCLALLIIRLVIAGIVFAVRRARKDTRESSKAGVIVNAVWSVFIIGISLVPAFIFAGYKGLETSGQYKVKETNAILIDKSRLETYENDGSNREIPIHFYYPDGNAENCPFVLFDHGSFGYYQSNTSLYMELASNGYVVASIDHPYYAFFTKDTNGKTIIVDMDFIQTAIRTQNNETTREEDARNLTEWLSVRYTDNNFVLDTVKTAKENNALDDSWYTENGGEILKALGMTDMSKIGLTGHSIGGAAAVYLGRERDDITAVIDIDGTMASERIYFDDGTYALKDEPYPIPVLALDNEMHGGFYTDYPDGSGMEYVNKHVLDNAVDGREMSFAGTAHIDFTDLPLLSPAIAKSTGMSISDAREFIPQLNSLILNYFNYYLKGEGELMIGEWNS